MRSKLFALLTVPIPSFLKKFISTFVYDLKSHGFYKDRHGEKMCADRGKIAIDLRHPVETRMHTPARGYNAYDTVSHV